MLLSMTGYGRASGNFNGKNIHAEVRALNSKLTDLKLRVPSDYREKEVELRKLISDHAERGKIDVVVDLQSTDGAANVSLNEALFRGYHRELTRISAELHIQHGDILQTILRIPNVVMPAAGELDDQEWEAVGKVLTEALDNLKKFRQQEGAVLAQDLRMRVGNIMALLTAVSPFEEERFARMRERLQTNMTENLSGSDAVDQNRFEQEILYYLEKMDITEEKVRLENHCKYFLETMDKKDQAVGRTLGFISQEIGREINTLGAKAYDSDIQRLVVQMKDELEKIKEQLANVL